MESLIESVKQFPCLWKINDIYYRDVTKKDAAWERVAKQCNLVNGKEAKNQWKKLRDSHREALRRRRSATAQILKPWKYEALMEFVLHPNENVDTYSTSNTTTSTVTQDSNSSSDSDSTTPPGSPHPSMSYMDHDSKKHQIVESPHFDTSRVQPDALSNLFASLYQKTRELPKHLQLRVQREIFESVTRAEEEAMVFNPLETHFTSGIRNTSADRNSSFSDGSTDTKPQALYAHRS